jgi:hypothetical protein
MIFVRARRDPILTTEPARLERAIQQTAPAIQSRAEKLSSGKTAGYPP